MKPPINQMHALLIDVHRKFEKSVNKGQATSISQESESKAYEACQLKKTEPYKEYFRLFHANNTKHEDLEATVIEQPRLQA